MYGCVSCSTPLDPANVDGERVTCRWCRVTQRAPFPGARRPVSSLDTTTSSPWGFTSHGVRAGRGPDGAPELYVELEPSDARAPVERTLASTETFDDFEATLRFRFLFGDAATSVGLIVRHTTAAWLSVLVSMDGTMPEGERTGTATSTLPWMKRLARAPDVGVENELTVRAQGEDLFVRMNGEDVWEVHDASHPSGQVVVVSRSRVHHAYAIRSLFVRPLLRVERPPPLPGPLPRTAGPFGSRVVPHVGGAFRHAPDGQGIAVILHHAGRTAACIDAILDLTGWGVAEAESAAEETPTILGDAVDRAEAQRWIVHLAAAGATAR